MRAFHVVPWVLLLFAARAAAQSVPDTVSAAPAMPAEIQTAPAPSPGGGSANATNPAISVIGWFQGSAGNDPTLPHDAMALPEAELGFQSAVDPFTRADFFMSATPEGLDVEEGYLTWLALPGGGQAKVGRFRTDLGKFNRTHPPETPFADRPLVELAFLGEEGLTTSGVAASLLVPNPLGLYWDAVVNVGTIPSPGESPVFFADERSDLLTVARTSAFVPLHESADLNLGLSYANGLADSTLRSNGSRSQLGVADLTFHWKNPRRSIYRALIVQAEGVMLQGTDSGSPRTGGTFAYALWQFARQWKAGVRGDWSESPGVSDATRGVLALLQYQPSEFSTMSVQARRTRDPGGDTHDAIFFKWLFNIGPHGAHPY